MSLNGPQRNSLTVTLRLVERILAQVERLAEEEDGLLYRVACGLPSAEREALTAQVREARAEVAALARHFGLEKNEELAEQRMAALLSSAWAHVEEARPVKLKRYGEVDPALEETLGPGVERLARVLLTAASLVQPGRRISDHDAP